MTEAAITAESPLYLFDPARVDVQSLMNGPAESFPSGAVFIPVLMSPEDPAIVKVKEVDRAYIEKLFRAQSEE